MLLLAAAHECGSAVFGEPPARVARLHRRVWLLVIQPCNKPSESMTGPAKEREQVYFVDTMFGIYWHSKFDILCVQ